MSKIIWIIGATGGIGTHLSGALARRGHTLVLSARTAESLESLAATTGGVSKPLDAADFEATFATAQSIVAEFGRLDAVVHLPGSILLKPEHLTSESEFDQTLDTNLKSAFSVVRAATKAMYSTGGSIVLMSTAAASIGMKNHGAIAAAKAGVEGLTRSAAATYANRGIRINAVAPGMVETPLSARILSNPQSREYSESLHALGRIGQPADVSSAIEFLVGDDSSWMTGAVMPVDGGLSAVMPR